MTVAKHYCRITCHKSRKLFLISTAVYVIFVVVIGHIVVIRIIVISFSDTFFADITGTYVQCQKFNFPDKESDSSITVGAKYVAG